MDLQQITFDDMVVSFCGCVIVPETDISDPALDDSLISTFLVELPDYGYYFQEVLNRRLNQPSFKSPDGNRIRFLYSDSQFVRESARDLFLRESKLPLQSWHAHLIREAARYLESLIAETREEAEE